MENVENVVLKSWTGENRQILNLPILQSKLPSKDLKLKSYEVNLIYRRYFVKEL